MPDYLAPFTAYRVWQWDEDGVKSLNHAEWTPGVAFEAKCANLESQAAKYEGRPEIQAWLRQHEHPVPGEDCSCGMYAGIDLQHLINIGYAGQGIHGEVLLWGRLVECTLGWRAQYAYPKFFVVPQSMFPFNIREIERRMRALIAFDVDVYVQPANEPSVGGERIPLWMKGFGWSQQGLGHLVDLRKRWYDYRPQVRDAAPGDRIAAIGRDGGIGIVRGVAGDELHFSLFGTALHTVPLKQVRWNERNMRWETPTLGARRSVRHMHPSFAGL